MQNNDIELIAERFLKQYASGYLGKEEQADRLADSMQADGSWSDLDYEGENLPFWRCIKHFDRLNYLAMSGKYDDKVIAGLKFWYQKERKDPNWWWNCIGIPMDLAVSGILLRDKFDENLKKTVCEAFNEYIDDVWTGTNRSWFAQNVIVRGIISDDVMLIERGKKYMEDNIFMSEYGEDGIQPDFAFAQHGQQLYNNGYGQSMVTDACSWIEIFKDTSFQFSQDKIDIITSLLLDGHGHMCFCDIPDFNAMGRDIVRGYKEKDTRMRRFLHSADVLKTVSGRTEELEALKDFISGNQYAFDRTKMFSSLGIMTGVHNGGYSSVRFGSDKILAGDVYDGKIINGEDVLSGFRGCFATQYMVNGCEYDRIMPLWNWAFLPGVTCPEIELKTERGAIMSSKFVGGASDGKNGVCGMNLMEDFSCNDETVVFGGKKACFFIGNTIIHLGCELYSETTLNTTVDQCLFNNKFTVDGEVYGAGDTVKKEIKYVFHNNIGYVFAEKTKAVAFSEHRKGIWNKITFIPETIYAEGDVFTVYMPQKENNHYEYAVIMNTDEEEIKKFVFPEFTNNRFVQAVKKDNIIGAVLYEKGEHKIFDKMVECNKPCFLIINDNKIVSVKSEVFADKEISVKIK